MRAGTRRFPAAPRPAWVIADKVVISGVSCLETGGGQLPKVLTGGKRSNYFPARATGGVSPVAVLSVPGRCSRPGQDAVCCGLPAFWSSYGTWAPFSSPTGMPSSLPPSLPSFKDSWQPPVSSRSGYYGSVLLRPLGCGMWGCRFGTRC